MRPKSQGWLAELTVDFRHPTRRWGYVFMLPGILYFAIFLAWPILSTLWLSLTEWRGFQSPATWIGLDNYKVIFTQDAEFGRSMGNTFYYVALVVPASILLPLVLALLFDNEFPLKDFFRTVYFLPSITSMVAIGMMWTWAYEPLFGIFNGLLKAAHLRPLAYLKDTAQAMPAVAVVGIWSVVGYNMVILRAGLTAVPAEYYEAATMDGASWGRRVFGITLPLLMPTITFLVVTSMINNLQVFTQVYVMTHGGPGNATRVVAYHMYETGFSYFWFGKASAMAVILFLIIMAITLVQMRLLQREGR